MSMNGGNSLLRLRSRLIARRDALRKAIDDDLGRLREASEVVGHGDQVDAAVDSANDEICSRMAEIESRELAQIERALRRIDEGGYGRCASCGGEIPRTRLNALPYTVRCIGCQRIDEARGRAGSIPRDDEGWARVDDALDGNRGGDPAFPGGQRGRGFDPEDDAGSCRALAARMG